MPGPRTPKTKTIVAPWDELPLPSRTIATEQFEKLDAHSLGRLIAYMNRISQCADMCAQVTTFHNQRVTMATLNHMLEVTAAGIAHARDILGILPEQEEVKSANQEGHNDGGC